LVICPLAGVEANASGAGGTYLTAGRTFETTITIDGANALKTYTIPNPFGVASNAVLIETKSGSTSGSSGIFLDTLHFYDVAAGIGFGEPNLYVNGLSQSQALDIRSVSFNGSNDVVIEAFKNWNGGTTTQTFNLSLL